jgi:RHS repeat-associated protein
VSAPLSNGTAVSYSYDGRGNRLSGSGPAVAYTVNENNQLTSRSVGTLGRGYGVSGKVAPGSQVKVFHPGAPQGEVLTAHPSTGVYEKWWGDPGAGVTRVELLVRGTKPGAGESGRDAVADQKVWVSLPLSSESYTYDGAGRLSEDGTWWYNWNTLGQLTSLWRKPNTAPDPKVNTESISYSYDSDGRRTGRTRTVTYFDSTPTLTETSKVLWEKWHPVMEERTLNGAALPRRWFVWGRDVSGSIGGAGGIGGLVSIKEDGGRTLLPMDDGLGNIIAVVDASTRGVIARYDYGPFGEIVSENGEVGACPFRFQSKWWDAAAGLNYFGYRHYNPKMGRWLSRDPLGEAGGFNLYAYCGNDPVNKWDYLGMDTHAQLSKRLGSVRTEFHDALRSLEAFDFALDEVLEALANRPLMLRSVPVSEETIFASAMARAAQYTGKMTSPDLADWTLGIASNEMSVLQHRIARLEGMGAFLAENATPGVLGAEEAALSLDDTSEFYLGLESDRFWTGINPSAGIARHYSRGEYGQASLEFGKGLP